MQFDPSEHARLIPVSAAEARMWAGFVDVAMNPGATRDQRLAVEMHLVAEVMGDLVGYTRIPSPIRPDLLPDSDQALLDKLKFTSTSVRASDSDREVTKAFADWRYGILFVENANAMRVQVLLEVARTLASTVAQYPAERGALANLLAFLAAEWGVRTDLPIPDRWEACRVARYVAQDLQSLPSSLREPARHGHHSGGGQAKRGGSPERAKFNVPTQSWHDQND